MRKVSIPTVAIGALVVLILLSFFFVTQVSFSQVGVRVRLGRADQRSVLDKPGPYFHWPSPIESIWVYDQRLQTLDTPETEIKTIDGKNVIIGCYAVWTIQDPLRFYTRVPRHEPAEAEKQMRARLSQVQAAVIGQRTLAHFVNLNAEETEKNYNTLLQEMHDRVAPALLADYGIDVKQIGLRRISLPKEVTQKVFEAMRQERIELAERYRSEGQSRANAISARAEAEANQILAFTDARAADIRSAGQRAAAEIYAKIPAADQEFFEWLRWLDALKAALQQKTTFFLDEKNPFFGPFVHPPVPAEGQPKPQEPR